MNTGLNLPGIDAFLLALGPTFILIADFAGILMLVFSMFSIVHQKQRDPQYPIHKELFGIVIGSMLATSGSLLSMVSGQFFNAAPTSALGYDTAAGYTGSTDLIHTAMMVVALVGVYGVFSGFMSIKGSADDPKEFWPGARKLMGGIVALNANGFLLGLGGIMGGGVGAAITKILS